MYGHSYFSVVLVQDQHVDAIGQQVQESAETFHKLTQPKHHTKVRVREFNICELDQDEMKLQQELRDTADEKQKKAQHDHTVGVQTCFLDVI